MGSGLGRRELGRDRVWIGGEECSGRSGLDRVGGEGREGVHREGRSRWGVDREVWRRKEKFSMNYPKNASKQQKGIV